MAAEVEKREKRTVTSNAAEQMEHAGTAYSPDVDIYASEDKLLFAVEMPGVAKGDVTIHVDETDSLIIRGKNTAKENESSVVLRQYQVGDYYRAFQLSEEYDKDKISAKLENGLLLITVPKREEAKPKRIEIKA